MKASYKLALVLSLTTILAVTGCKKDTASTEKTDKASSKGLVATYEGGKITQVEANFQLRDITGNPKASVETLDPSLREAILKEIIARKLVASEAKKAGIAKEKEVKAEVKIAEERVIREEFLNRTIKAAITEEKIKASYDTMIKEIKGKEELRARHILVKDKETADKIYAQLQAKQASFADLALKYSLDPVSKNKGGDLGYFLPGQLNKTFEDAAGKLSKGSISAPIQTRFGWHIIQLDDRRQAEASPYDQMKPYLTQKLYQQALRNYTKDLLDKANVKFTAPKAEGKNT